MEDSGYLKLKSKGIIDENDNVKFSGELVPYYYLNEELTAFNPPRGTMPYQSDEWFYRFLKKHGRLRVNINPRPKITDEIFRLIDNGKYKKRNLIKALREKFSDVSSGVICRLIKRKLELRQIEIDRTYKTKPYVIKGKYFIGG